jgi:hypothetical protein
MLSLELPTLAPLVSDILHDPQELAAMELHPVYVYRDVASVPYRERPRNGAIDWLEVTTEAGALRDLDRYLNGSRKTLKEHKSEDDLAYVGLADELQHGLRFMGNQMRTSGEQAMAEHWLERLQSSPDGEVHVSVPAFESGGLILQGVLGRLALLDADAADATHPFNPYDPADARMWGRRQRNGVIIADDWTMTGKQVIRHINGLVDNGGLTADDIEANYLCASDRHVQEGIKGVRVLSRYTYPAMPTRRGPAKASITGSHAAPDHGFRIELNGIANHLERIGRESSGVSPGWRFPLLHAIAKVYKWQNFEGMTRVGDPEQFAAFDAAVAAYRQGTERLRQQAVS